MEYNFHIDVLLFEEPCGESSTVWIAQAVQYDICAYGPTVEEAQKRFENTLINEILLCGIHGREPLESIAHGPKTVRDRYQTADNYGWNTVKFDSMEQMEIGKIAVRWRKNARRSE